ncbi:MAG: ABC transporter substrate-binding protein [Candidatus Dormibacteria bacterium]
MKVSILPRLMFSVVVAVFAFGAVGSSAPQASLAAQTAVSGAIPVDRQAYVADQSVAGKPVDPYNADTLEVHVSYSGSQTVAHGFFHLELDAIPQGSTLTGAMAVFKTNAGDSAPNDVNPSAATIKACLLKTELAGNFDAGHPPAYDPNVCAKGKMTTEPAPGNTTRTIFTFDLAPLIGKWTKANTGAALVPDNPPPSSNWSVGLDKTLSASMVDYLMPASQPTSSTQAPAQSSLTYSNPNPAPAVAPPAQGTYAVNPPPAVQAPSSITSDAAPPAAPHSAGGGARIATPTAPTGFGYPLWMLVLVGGLGIALALVGQPLTQALSEGGGISGMLAPLRLHPRMFYIAGMLAVTTGTYSVYSLANGQGLVRASQGGVAANATPGSNNPSSGASPTASAGNGAAAAAGAAPGSLAATLPEHPVGQIQRVGNTSVVIPQGGGPPVANIFSGAEDTVGIDQNYINLCSHAALIFGPALHLGKADLAVFWQNLNENGPYWLPNAGYKGIFGRKVVDTYNDDQYAPGPAVQAAQACKDQQNPTGADGAQSDTSGTFFLSSGIGFDQIPAVRQWAESNHMLYYHHMATSLGGEGRYSFSSLPTVEGAGTFLGQYAESKFKGHTFGVLWRNSTNWQGGSDAFKSYLESHGEKVPVYAPVNNNQGNYAQEIAQLKAAHVDVALAFENALGTPEIIKQAQQQGYNPHWLVASFNIVPMTVGANATPPDMNGFGSWPAYNCHTYDGGYSPVAADIREFEREYAKYDPQGSQNLCGSNSQGADLLYDAWAVEKQIAQMLIDCGPQCTRNKVAGMLLSGYKQIAPPSCPQDWSRKRQFGSAAFDITKMWRNPADNQWDLRPDITCAEHIP